MILIINKDIKNLRSLFHKYLEVARDEFKQFFGYNWHALLDMLGYIDDSYRPLVIEHCSIQMI